MAAKHAGHAPTLQPRGKDSRAYLDAGAGESIVISGKESMLVRRFDSEADAAESVREHWRLFDVVLLEGRIFNDVPVVEVISEPGASLRTTGPNLAAVVSDGDTGIPVPHFRRDDVEAIARFMEEKIWNIM